MGGGDPNFAIFVLRNLRTPPLSHIRVCSDNGRISLLRAYIGINSDLGVIEKPFYDTYTSSVPAGSVRWFEYEANILY